MKYVTTNGNIATVDNIPHVCMVGDPSPRDGWTIAGRYVSDWFDEKLYDNINEEMCDFQTDNDIDDGGLPPELEAELENRIEALRDTIAECKVWQLMHKGWTQVAE